MQVGLIAVNVLGDETDAVTASNGKLSSPVADGQNQGQAGDGAVSLYDDLAFQMYVDQDAARIIREMEARKLVAVQGESGGARYIPRSRDFQCLTTGNNALTIPHARGSLKKAKQQNIYSRL